MSKLVKANLIMLGLLLVQAIVIVALPKEGASAKAADDDTAVAGRQPYSSVQAKDARAVTITSGDGKVVKLSGGAAKEGDKDVTTWVLANRDGFPARAADVEKIIDAVKKITLSRVITRQEKRYARLKVADGVMHARVQIAGEGGRTLSDFRLGEGDFNSVHLRIEGDPAVYEATGVSTWEFPVAVSGLVDTSFLDLPADQVVKVRVSHAAEMFDVVKEAPESRPESQPASRGTDTGPATRGTETKPEPRWVSGGKTLDKTKVDSWIRALTRVSLGDPIGKEKKPEYGFEKPTATVVLTMADGKETTIVVGAERKEEHDYYLTATGKDFVVTVASWSATDQFQKKLKDLLPGTPSATAPGHEDHDDHR
jgi:Domain of unknown function (DUF4340)